MNRELGGSSHRDRETGEKPEILETPDKPEKTEKSYGTVDGIADFEDCRVSETKRTEETDEPQLKENPYTFEDCGREDSEDVESEKKDDLDFENCEKQDNPEKAEDDAQARESTDETGETNETDETKDLDDLERSAKKPETGNLNTMSVGELKDTSAKLSEEIRDETDKQAARESQASQNFEKVTRQDSGTDEFKQALEEYNRSKAEKEAGAERLDLLNETKDRTETAKDRLSEAQYLKYNCSLKEYEITRAQTEKQNEKFDAIRDSDSPEPEQAEELWSRNEKTIRELSAQRDICTQVMDNKYGEIADDITSQNMDRIEAEKNQHHQMLVEQYNDMKEQKDILDTDIAGLENHNRILSEDYHLDRAEVQEKVAVLPEIAEGRDDPSETDYFSDEIRTSQTLEPFVNQDSWENKSMDEKKTAIQELADYNADILGIEDKPDIVYYNDPDPAEYGGYQSKTNTIGINEYNLSSADDVSKTICHEYRHKYQDQSSQKLRNTRELDFRENIDHPVNPDQDYQGYLNSPAEADAWTYEKSVQEELDKRRKK